MCFPDSNGVANLQPTLNGRLRILDALTFAVLSLNTIAQCELLLVTSSGMARLTRRHAVSDLIT